MSKSKLIHVECAVDGCASSTFNKFDIGTTFHSFPTSSVMRSKWLSILEDRCSLLDWSRSKICSNHFDQRCFNSQKKLKDDAIPVIFLTRSTKKIIRYRPKVDRLLGKLTQQQLVNDINDTMSLIKVPNNFSDCVDDDLQCIPDTPVEAQLWLLIKKQDHLISRLSQVVTQNKKHVEVLQNNIEESRASKKSLEQNLESYKYIAKSLQEKQATLEEQIEILTAVESR